MTEEYDRGFADGLRWVAMTLRRSALIVETPLHGDFESGDGRSYSAILRTGNPYLASQYRAVAQLLEDAAQPS